MKVFNVCMAWNESFQCVHGMERKFSMCACRGTKVFNVCKNSNSPIVLQQVKQVMMQKNWLENQLHEFLY